MNISIFFHKLFRNLALNHLLLIIFVITASMFFSLRSSAQAVDCITIDDYEHTTELSEKVELDTMNPGPVEVIDNGAPGVLGTFRNITFGPHMGFITTDILIRDDGRFAGSNDGLTRAPVSILYNANGSGLNQDFSNAVSIVLDLVSNDNMGLEATFILTDSSNNSANFFIASLPNEDEPDPGVPTLVEVPLEEFENIGALELSSIDSIEISFNPTRNGADYSFTELQFCEIPTTDVPTLSQWGLIAIAGVLGLIGFIVIRRKKAAV